MSATGAGDGRGGAGGGYDLHTHTRCSDGVLAPAGVVALAGDAGLDGIAVTDHDTTAGIAEAEEASARLGLELVPGIELSAEADGRSVHVLGYWIDPHDTALAAECARLRDERDRRARAMLARLAALGVAVAEERVRELAAGAPLGRPHLAAALVECGAAADLDDAFARYLRDGGPAWEPKRALDPARAVALLRAAGGVAVLAHPECSQVGSALLDRMVDAGLAGLECDHPAQGPDSARAWRARAERRDLVATGASDFHGTRREVKIGERTTGSVGLEKLRARRGDPRAAPAGGQRGRTRSW